MGFFLGKLANVLLSNFYYNALGAFFDALIQRTDGSTGIDFFTFYANTGAEKCNHQLVVATTGAFTLTSVMNDLF